ncbi:MAG: hypothetical protein F4X16_03420 [Caldilineaceae bacterium SB0661_bin_34]|nr:hypothetical protein [Caldilineaceae bacterium SB0661_bin_34]
MVWMSSEYPCGQAVVDVDRDYTEAYTDSDEERHGQGLGDRLSAESDSLKVKECCRTGIRGRLVVQLHDWVWRGRPR